LEVGEAAQTLGENSKHNMKLLLVLAVGFIVALQAKVLPKFA
jgi:hypothetical protein